jgi:hypothetical protein
MSKKALTIRPILGSPHYCILWEGGGEVPGDLTGAFTTPASAKRAIAAWEAANREEAVEVKEYAREEPPRRGRPPAKSIGG